VSGSGISWAICKSALRSRQIAMPAPHQSVFTGRMPFLPTNRVKPLKAQYSSVEVTKKRICTNKCVFGYYVCWQCGTTHIRPLHAVHCTSSWSISPACRATAVNVANVTHAGTDGLTLYRFIDSALTEYYMGSASNKLHDWELCACYAYHTWIASLRQPAGARQTASHTKGRLSCHTPVDVFHTKTSTTTTILRLFCRSTCISHYFRLRRGDFVGAKFYCPDAFAGGSQHIQIRKKTLEFSTAVLSTLFPYR